MDKTAETVGSSSGDIVFFAETLRILRKRLVWHETTLRQIAETVRSDAETLFFFEKRLV